MTTSRKETLPGRYAPKLSLIQLPIPELREPHLSHSIGKNSGQDTLEIIECIMVIARNLQSPLFFHPCITVQAVIAGNNVVLPA